MSNSHSNSHKKNRRDFLKLSTKLAALGVTSLGVGLGTSRKIFAAESATTAGLTDYKALVCVYLFGGNDGNNMIVPLDTTRYTQYQQLRPGIALNANTLLSPISDGKGGTYALHYGMPEINAMYNAGQAAFVLNMGQLDQPLTRAQYLAGQNTPTNLFSHSDQIVQAQTGTSKPDGSGWGGRLLDCCGVNDTLAAISMSSPALFLQGFQVSGNVIPPGQGLNLSGMSFWPQNESAMRRNAVDQLLTIDGGNAIGKAANRQMADGLQLATALKNAGTSNSSFSFPGTSIGNQLKEVANLIQLRSSQGPGRQVFFVSMDGYDLHSGQDWNHWYLLSTLSLAVSAFNNAVQSMPGLNDKVTLFTQSEFGRTLQPSGTGSDHAWGSHQVVIGGAVKGGIYGAYPTLALGGPDDANNRGVWIPTVSTGQFGATLGKWFGASDADLLWAFDNLDKFPTWDLGFMHAS
jgi:uncharacterized protein (DUF1501 family)